MPRANRYIQPGCLYHLTHRCHDRRFLLHFARDRNEYQKRLRQAVNKSPVSLLNYCITSNHTHLLVETGTSDGLSIMMQQLEGQFAQWYNWRKKRSGAFWEDRYHCTMVDGNPHLLNCMVYIDMNMVRAGVVEHPRDWRWCGHDELTGHRQRYRLLDLDCVLKWQGDPEPQTFADEYGQWIDEAVERRELGRNPIWTEEETRRKRTCPFPDCRVYSSLKRPCGVLRPCRSFGSRKPCFRQFQNSTGRDAWL